MAIQLKERVCDGKPKSYSIDTVDNVVEHDKPKPLDKIISENAASAVEDDHYYPEGGLKAWSVTLGTFLALFPAWGLVASSGVNQEHLIRNQLKFEDISKVSWVFSVNIFIMFVCSVFSGLYFDRNGATVPIVAGGLLCFAGVFAVGSCTQLWQFVLAFSVCVGVGNGLVLSPVVSAVCHYFNKRRAFASAISQYGGTVGGAVFPVIFTHLFHRVGYTWTMRIVAFVCLACYIGAAILVKEARKTDLRVFDTKWETLRHYLVNSFDFSAFKEVKFVLLAIATMFVEILIPTMATHRVSYAVARGFAPSTASLFVTVTNSVSVAGGFILCLLADQWFGCMNTQILSIFIASSLILIMVVPFGDRAAVMWTFSALYGFFYGCVITLIPVICAKISHPNNLGKRLSTMYVFSGLGALIGIPVAGAIIDEGRIREYNGCMIFIACCGYMGAVFYAFLKIYLVGSVKGLV